LGDKDNMQEVNDCEVTDLYCSSDCGQYLKNSIQMTPPYFRLPFDGGGLRWGWTGHLPPHPRPLPPGERGIIEVFF
jgi:hypothetical protein